MFINIDTRNHTPKMISTKLIKRLINSSMFLFI